MKCICVELTNPEGGVNRKATMCMGHFACILGTKQLEKLMETEIAAIDPNNPTVLLTHLQSLSQITRSTGEKLAKYFDTFLPKLMQLLSLLAADSSDNLNNEIGEAALASIESMIRKCPNETKGMVQEIH